MWPGCTLLSNKYNFGTFLSRAQRKHSDCPFTFIPGNFSIQGRACWSDISWWKDRIADWTQRCSNGGKCWSGWTFSSLVALSSLDSATNVCCISSSLVTLSLSVSSVSLCRLRAFLCSSRLPLSSWDSDEATRAFLALSFSLLFLRRSSLCASVSDARLALSRAFLFCRLSAVALKDFFLYEHVELNSLSIYVVCGLWLHVMQVDVYKLDS